tara:strand:+ start:51208 stop:51948 length:741 start_codon:yes stop_codon:yes gene_type:complete
VVSIELDQHLKKNFKILANRDEYYERDSIPMHWWDFGGILAGRDVEGGGTWMGMNKSGRFAALTNVKETKLKEYKNSRGELVLDFLSSSLSIDDYFSIKKEKEFAGYNLLIGDKEEVAIFSNRSSGLSFLSAGVYGIGNLPYGTDSKKVDKVKKDFVSLLDEGVNKNSAVKLMQLEDGHLLEKTLAEMKPRDEEEIGYRFIKSGIYGTRCTTYIEISSSGEVKVTEKNYNVNGEEGTELDFSFTSN